MPITEDELIKRKSEFQVKLQDLVFEMCSEEYGIGAMETVLELEAALTNAQSVNINSVTVEGQLDLWFRNFRTNYLRWIWGDEADFREDIFLGNRPVLVIGAGPSITDEQLSHIRKFDIICTNKILRRVLDYATPKLCVVLDGNIEVLRSFEGLDKELHHISFLLPSTVHPDVTEYLWNHEANIYWFNPSIPSEYASNVNYAFKMFSDNKLLTIDTGGNVGIWGTVVAKMLGAKTICLLGLEHAHVLNPAWTMEQALAYKIVYDPRDGMIYAITPSFQSYINTLVGFIKENPDIEFVNFTKFGWMYTMRNEIPIRYIPIEEWEDPK